MSAEWGDRAGCVPLFDRLIDEALHRKHEPKPLRTLDRAGVIDSIGRELLRLFSTRCTVTGDVALSRTRSVLDYGLPISTWGLALVAEPRLRLARISARPSRRFEPRLANVHVVVRDIGEVSGKLTAVRRGYLVTGDINEPLSFMLPIGSGAGADGGCRSRADRSLTRVSSTTCASAVPSSRSAIPRSAVRPRRGGAAGGRDPHVERLMESFAFLTARLQHQLDRGSPRELTTGLLGVLLSAVHEPHPFDGDRVVRGRSDEPRARRRAHRREGRRRSSPTRPPARPVASSRAIR